VPRKKPNAKKPPAPPEAAKPAGQQPGVVELARKGRYVFLLEKVRHQQHLTPAELKELQSYEALPDGQSTGDSRRPSPGFCSTQQELADYFEVDVRTVRNWTRGRTPCPKERDGSFSIRAVTEWYDARHGRKAEVPVDMENDADYWDMRYRRAKALMSEDELARRRHELGRLDDFRREYGRHVQSGIYRLRGLGTKLAAAVIGLAPYEVKTLVDGNTLEIEQELLAGGQIELKHKKAKKARKGASRLPTGQAGARSK